MNMLQNEQSSDEQWKKAAFENNWKITDQLQLVQFRSNTRYAKNVYTDYLSAEIENQWQGCVCLNYRERLLMLINLDQFKSVNDKNFYLQLLFSPGQPAGGRNKPGLGTWLICAPPTSKPKLPWISVPATSQCSGPIGLTTMPLPIC